MTIHGKTHSMKESVFIYTSKCCSAPATKPACVKSKSVAYTTSTKKNKKHRETPEVSSLGHWSCSACGKACKVSVHKRLAKSEVSNG